MMDIFVYILVSTFIVVTLIFLFLLIASSKSKKKLIKEIEQNKEQFESYRQETEPLKKYQVIQDAGNEAKQIEKNATAILIKAQSDYDKKINEANSEANRISSKAESLRKRIQSDFDKKINEAKLKVEAELKDSRSKAKEIREKAEKVLENAHDIASKIETDAKEKATQIAGDAWEAKRNADQYEATVKAMKNIIKGYGDEYLVPNHNVLDELATEYDHKAAGQELAKIRTLIKSMIKNEEAAECDYVEAYRKATAIEFVLDAFNGKIDSVMAKVKHDNYGVLKQRIEDAFRIVNHNGKAFRNARIVSRYFDVIMDQLKMAVAVQELKRIDQEEQRRIKEQIREENQAKREYEKAIREAEKEERMLQKAMADAEKKLATAAEEDRLLLEEQIAELKEKLLDAEAKEQRAISMAQQTKQGHVYIISNVGSFGDEVLKIGLTRRLEPLDRVKELGDASVPFKFDVHAMIHSDDAPALESALHQHCDQKRVNKVNSRKEFFKVPLSEIKAMVEELGLNAHWTHKAEALEYRESLQLEKGRAVG